MKKEQEEKKKEQLAQQQEKKDKMMRMRILRNKMMAARAGTEVNASHQPEGDLISDECDKCDGDHDTKDHDKKEDEDPRSMKTKINLSRNKLRAMGLKMSYDMGDEVVEDADLDKMQKDADANRARAAKLKDRNVTRGSASFAAAKQLQILLRRQQNMDLNNIRALELV